MKRFVDTDIWEQEWFMLLTPKIKCFVRFVFDKCDNSGVWHPNYSLAGTYIGEPVNQADLISVDGGRQFEKMDNGKIFLPGFIRFQYGELSEKCMPHKKVFSLLKKHGLTERVLKGYQKGINTLEEEDKEEEGDKEEVKEDIGGAGGKGKWNTYPKPENVEILPNDLAKSIQVQYAALKQVTVSTDSIFEYWRGWIRTELTGEKHYHSQNEVYKHFTNKIMQQKFYNGSASDGKKAGSFGGTRSAFEAIDSMPNPSGSPGV